MVGGKRRTWRRVSVSPLMTQLRLARRARGMSLETAAGLAGTGPTTLSSWENGLHGPSLAGAEALAAALGLRLVLERA